MNTKSPLLASTLIAASFALSVPALADDLTWSGTNSYIWDTSTANWNGSTFSNNDNVTFTSTGEGTITISGTISAGTMTVSGGDYTFSATDSNTLTVTEIDMNGGSVTFDGSATIGTFNTATYGGSGKSVTLTAGTKLTVETLTNDWGASSFVLNAGSEIDVTSASFAIDSVAVTVSGSGTWKAGTFSFANLGTYTFEGVTLEVTDMVVGNSYQYAHVTIDGGTATIGTLSVNSEGSITFSNSGTYTVGKVTNSGTGTISADTGTTVGITTIETPSSGSLTLTGAGTFEIGSYGNDTTGATFAIGEGTTVNMGTFSLDWHQNTTTLGNGAVWNITSELALHTSNTEEFTGGTINAEKLNVYNGAAGSFSNTNLNIGSGGIVNSNNWGSYEVAFGDSLTVGVYAGANGDNTSWSSNARIHFTGTDNTGTTFYTEESESITLGGEISGVGFTNTGSGTLILSGTVSLDGAISNSGTIVVDTSSVVFNLDNLTATGDGTYVVIENSGGTIEGWDSLDASNFSYSGGTITSVTVSVSGQVTISTEIRDLIWNGGSEGTWDTSTANWTSDGGSTSVTFGNGDNVTFTKISEDKATVTVQDDGVTAGSVTVEGGTYSFAGSNTGSQANKDNSIIRVNGTFTIASGAEVDLDGAVVYADFVVNGTLKLDIAAGGDGTWNTGQYGEIHGTITINNGGWVELVAGDATGYDAGGGVTQITINEGGTLYVNTTANETLGSCDIILVGGTIDGNSTTYQQNLDFFHSSSLIVKAADNATAEAPTVSTVKNVMLTSRNDDGTMLLQVEENAKLLVESGFWSGPNSGSSYNGNIEKTGAGTLEVTGYFAINNGKLLVDEGTVILSGYAGGTTNSYGFASAITVADGALLNMCFAEDTTLSGVTFSGAGTIEVSGSKTLTINNYSFSGTTQIAEGNTLTITGTTASMGELALSGSSVVFNSSGASTATLSKVTVATSGTISVSNWYDHITIGELVGSGTLNLGNTASDNTASIYELKGDSSSFTGTISLSETNSTSGSVYRGVTLVISSASAAANAVIEFGAETNTNSCIALGVNASTVEIAGLSSNNSGGDVVYSGSVSLGATLGNQGATLIDYKNQGYGQGSAYDGVSVSRNTLVINTAADASYSFSGVFMDMLNIEKKGAGTQSITFGSSVGESAYYFDGTIAVTEGTLNLDGRATNSSGITVASGATLKIDNEITLTAASDLGSCSSTISGTLTLGESGKLSVGADATVTLNTTLGTSNTGTVEFASGAQLILTDAFLASAITRFDGEEQSIAIIMASSITFGSETLDGSQSSEDLDSLLADYVSYSDSYQLTWSYADGTLSAAVTYLPEPSMFGIFAGLGTLGLVATRRRRRKAA